MATNAQLKYRIAELVEELDLDSLPAPEHENNASLAAIVADLETKLQVRNESRPKPIDGDIGSATLGGAPPAPKPAPAPSSRFEYAVAPNCAHYTRRGRLFGGEQIIGGDLPDDVLRRLVKVGSILHNPDGAKIKHKA